MPLVLNGTTGVNTDGQGNLTFSGTGQRIVGDFSNATVANRVLFQTSTVNGSTSINTVPNGTSVNSGINCFNAADPANAGFGGFLVGSTEVQVRSGITGTGTFLPITFYTGGSERMRLDTSGNVGIGNPAANVNDQVGAVRPLLVSKSDTSTTIAGSQANIVIGNADTTTNNTAQLTFAAITGANTTYFASAAINCIFGARTNAQYPTGQLVFSTSTALNLAPTEKMRIDSSGNLLVNTTTNTNNSRIVSNGVVESTTGGFRFPDGTTQTTAAGALTTAAVLSAYAGAAYGAVGSFIFAANSTASNILVGGTLAGSSLTKVSTSNTSVSAGVSGTWRLMGANENNANNSWSALWLRIS